MSLEITGKLITKLPQQTGQGKNGTWIKQDFIIETQDQFPKKVCISLWGEKAKELDAIAMGENVKAGINIESREFNGKWYTDVKAWKIEKTGAASSQKNDLPPMPTDETLPPFLDPSNKFEPTDDLPF
ncbi:MAG: DUF3127 domain-containing protein [Tenuifilaceae bacterium]